MDNKVINIADFRRKLYEQTKSEEELSRVDFDVYGNPISLCIDTEEMIATEQRVMSEIEATNQTKLVISDDATKLLIKLDPHIARSLKLFPKLSLIKGE